MRATRYLAVGIFVFVCMLDSMLLGYARDSRTDQSAAFQTGKTTLKQVDKALGYAPNLTTAGPGAGTQTVCWQYVGGPEAFIPVIGTIATPVPLTCCYRFNAKGVLAAITATDNPHDANRPPSCPPRLLRAGTTVQVPMSAGVPRPCCEPPSLMPAPKQPAEPEHQTGNAAAAKRTPP